MINPLNVDGFLNDFCEFDIGVTTRTVGLPYLLPQRDTILVHVTLKGKSVRLLWEVNAEQVRQLKKANKT